MATELQTKYWESLKGKRSLNKGKKFPYKARPNAVGRTVWNKGIILSEEICQTMSDARNRGVASGTVKSWNKGKKMSAESIENNRKGQLGKVLSIETRKKISEAKKGDKSYPWKGGVTPANRKIRNSFEMKLWRKACFERDNWTCQKYGVRTGGLEVHHINNFADFPELRTSIENGVTLSKKAHQEFHKKYGFKDNSLEQLKEFLIT